MAILLADRLLPEVAEWFHSHPEHGFNTERTVGIICDHLRKWGGDRH